MQSAPEGNQKNAAQIYFNNDSRGRRGAKARRELVRVDGFDAARRGAARRLGVAEPVARVYRDSGHAVTVTCHWLPVGIQVGEGAA